MDSWKNLNTCTKRFPENASGGLLICGINWGGNPDDEPDSASPGHFLSFFSDARVNNYPFRNKLVDWFALWGRPLRTIVGTEGQFERSIIQCNWLDDQSRSMDGRNTITEAIAQIDGFVSLLEKLRPRLILLCGRALALALWTPACLSKVERVLGPATKPSHERRTVPKPNGGHRRRFVVSIQQFGNTTLVVVPHPTGSKGLANDYVTEFKNVIGPILLTYEGILADV